MAIRDRGDFEPERRAVDHIHLEDGTLVLFDPDDSTARVECDSPCYLPGRA